MKQKQILFAFALLLLAALGCGTVGNPVNGTTGSIQGEVESIDGVSFHVRLLKDGQLVKQTVVDGSFELNDIEAGDYTLHISAEGYQEMERPVTVDAGETLSLDKVSLIELAIPGHDLNPGEGLSIGSQAPDFELPDANGTLHALDDYIGNNKKVVLIFYRGGW